METRATGLARPPIDLSSMPAETLNQLVSLRAAHNGAETFVTFLADGDRDAHHLSFAGLEERSRCIGGLLASRGLQPGDRVLLILPTGLPFIEAFFGILAAGMVPVPAYPPARLARLEHYLRTLAGIVDTARCSAAIIDSRLIPLVGNRLPNPNMVMLSEADLAAADDPAPIFALEPSSAAFLQFTSGTTSRPRGVLLHQEQVMAQLRSYAETTGQGPGKVAVSWLPLYHDLGLIGKVFACLYAGMQLVLLSPVHFLKDPMCWLRAISRYAGTHTVGPNFAYSLCVRKCDAQRLVAEDIDLSSLEIMGMGGEPVSMATIEAFRSHFAPFGLRPEILCPCYGLAENTLGATGHRIGESTRSLTVSRAALQEGRVEAPSDAGDAWTLPSNGRAMPSMQLKIVGSEDEDLGERAVGEIWIQGPSVATGYFNDGAATRKAFLDRGDGRWLRTGDLGFLDQGDLYICGRQKDMMIVRGRNYHPQDLEEVVGRLEGVRTGNVIAFAVKSDDQQEHAVIVCEIDQRAGADRETVRLEIVSAVSGAFELPLHDVVFLPRGSVPKTSSGKLQRSLLKKAYEAGELASFAPAGRWASLKIWARVKLAALRKAWRSSGSSPAARVRGKEDNDAAMEVLDPRIVEAMRGASPAHSVRLSPRLRLDALGLDSLARMELWLAVESLYQAAVPEEAWGWSQTLGDVQRLAEKYRGTRPAGSAAKSASEAPFFVRKLLEEPPAQSPTASYRTPRTAPLAFGFISVISRLLWKFRVGGAEHLPRGGGYILAGNHLTYLDGPWIRKALAREDREKLIAMSWADLEQSPALSWFLSQIETIPIHPEQSFVRAMQSGLAALAAGRILLIFPEGQRSYSGQLETFRPGVGLLSLLSGRPILPFRIQHGFDIYPRHRFLPRLVGWRQRAGDRLGVQFGSPIIPPSHRPAQTWDQARQLVTQLRERVSTLSDGR